MTVPWVSLIPRFHCNNITDRFSGTADKVQCVMSLRQWSFLSDFDDLLSSWSQCNGLSQCEWHSATVRLIILSRKTSRPNSPIDNCRGTKSISVIDMWRVRCFECNAHAHYKIVGMIPENCGRFFVRHESAKVTKFCIHRPKGCYLANFMPDGACDADGLHVVITGYRIRTLGSSCLRQIDSNM